MRGDRISHTTPSIMRIRGGGWLPWNQDKPTEACNGTCHARLKCCSTEGGQKSPNKAINEDENAKSIQNKDEIKCKQEKCSVNEKCRDGYHEGASEHHECGLKYASDKSSVQENRPWWKRLVLGGKDDDVRGDPGMDKPKLPPGFVALDPILFQKIREIQRAREKAAAQRGPVSWFRRLMRFGVALATLQPVAVTLVLNVIKILLLLKKVLSGAFDLDMEDRFEVRSARSNTTFNDVVGVDEAKKELEDIVAYLKDPAKFTRLGGKMAKGVLLWGPPGTGKTLLARAIAGEAGVPFKYASGSEFEEMYVGVGARRVRDLFQAAKKSLPCIVFLDEIDAIGSSRSLTDQQSLRQTLNQILTELDGFTSSEGLIVIAATNFPEVLDKALLRPGRFDRHIEVPNPDVKGREDILKLHSRNVTVAPDVDLHIVARGTPGFSGAELASLVNKAACKAAKDDKMHVSMADFEYAKDLILMGSERSSSIYSEDNRKLTAFHEGGHALVACYTDGALPVHKATIVPRGQALGMVMQLPEKDMTSWSRRQMMAEMDVCMGGRAAEELIFGIHNITSGATSDLERATSIACSMVEKFGMSRRVGLVAYGGGGGGGGGGGRGGRGSEMSEETRAIVDEEVRKLTEGSYARAMRLLKSKRAALDSLAAALLEHETLSGDQVREILNESESQEWGILKHLHSLLTCRVSPRKTASFAEKKQMKKMEERLQSMEDQIKTLSNIAAQLMDLTVVIEKQGSASAAA